MMESFMDLICALTSYLNELRENSKKIFSGFPYSRHLF